MSAAPKFTAGPWMVGKIEGAHEITGVYISQPYEGRMEGGRIAKCFGNCLVTTDAEVLANASLIAAAPDLYAAAVAAIAYDAAIHSCANDPDKMTEFGTAQGDDLDLLYADWIDKARAALAKVSA